MNNKAINEFVQMSRDLISQAESDREVPAKRLLEAGASPLMVDALLDVARKEMWAVLFAHLVDVAIEWRRSEDNSGGDYNDGKRSGIEDCIRNVLEYAHVKSAGSS